MGDRQRRHGEGPLRPPHFVPMPGHVSRPYAVPFVPGPTVAVVVPCYRVRDRILGVLGAIGEEVDAIYVVDDVCPEQSGRLVEREVRDRRVRVIFHDVNRGVGGATMTGLRRALDDGADIVVKLDGDGQMNPELLPLFVEAVAGGEADYAKGNRFHDPEGLAAMPMVRLFGNAVLSFLAKLSTGYWRTFDPNNGYVAIHGDVARRLPFDRISQRYFFETDLLFRLNTLRAKVVDIPMNAVYAGEKSSLRIGKVIVPFFGGHVRNFFKRIFYNYFLRDFSPASLELLAGTGLLLFGVVYGLIHWGGGAIAAGAGTVMLAGLPVILGVQLLLAFIAYDIQSVPTDPLHRRLPRRRRSYRMSTAVAR